MEKLDFFSDEQLQSMARSGDRNAEEALASRYVRFVRVCSRPFFLAGGDSEDLTQEGMLGLLTAIREYNSERGCLFQTFAELCIRRRILSAVKSAGRMKHSPLNDGVSLEEAFGDEEQTGARPIPDFQRPPEEHVLARESENEFFQLFSQQLSAFEQKILNLYLGGYSYRDMSLQCGKDEKAIDNAVQRIRRKLARNPYFGDISKS